MQLNKVAGWSLCLCLAGSANFTRGGTCHEIYINMGHLLTLLLYRWRVVLRLQWCGVRARWTVVWATVLRHVHSQAALLFPPAVAPCLDYPLLTPAGRFFSTFTCTCRLYRYFITKKTVFYFLSCMCWHNCTFSLFDKSVTLYRSHRITFITPKKKVFILFFIFYLFIFLNLKFFFLLFGREEVLIERMLFVHTCFCPEQWMLNNFPLSGCSKL